MVLKDFNLSLRWRREPPSVPGPSPAALSLLRALEGPTEQAATVCPEMLSRSEDAGRRRAPLGRSAAQRPNAFPEEKQKEKSEQGRVRPGQSAEKEPLLPVVGPGTQSL